LFYYHEIVALVNIFSFDIIFLFKNKSQILIEPSVGRAIFLFLENKSLAIIAFAP
jgi:hypothetical protein